MPKQPFYVSTMIRLLSVMRKSFIFNQGSFLKIRINSNFSFDGLFRFQRFKFKAAASSNHPHRTTSLGKIEAGLVAISGYMNREVELYTGGSWISQTSFPASFCNYCDSFDSYSTATVNNELYIFGE